MNLFVKFNNLITKKKPNTFLNNNFTCPFCDIETLRKENGIIKQVDDMLIIKNKFPTIEHSFQTVLIETNTCDGNLSNYPKEKLEKLMKFAIDNWIEMDNSDEFKSVVLLKNHGLNSGGSIKHPHMQIVGFKEIDYRDTIKENHFVGIEIIKGDVDLTISTFPRGEFTEFNLSMPEENYEKFIPTFSDYLQKVVHYVLHTLIQKHQSFNLAFYRYNGKIIVKIIPRYINSIYLLGYNISQVPVSIEELANEIKEIYFKK